MFSLKFIVVVNVLLSAIVAVGIVWWMSIPKTWDVSFEQGPATEQVSSSQTEKAAPSLSQGK